MLASALSPAPLARPAEVLARALPLYTGDRLLAPSPPSPAIFLLQIAVHQHNVIYGLMEAAKQTLEGAIEPVVEERETGSAEVLETFTLTLNRKDRADGMAKHTVVAGARVLSGVATTTSLARVMRAGKQVHDGKVISLRHFKQEVRSMKKGSECGMILHDFSGLDKGDLVLFYEMVTRKPALYEAEPTTADDD